MALIEREAALRILHENPMGTWRNMPVYSAEIKAAIQELEDLSTIDPIRAAGGCRCGECEYWDDDGRCEPPENGLIREYTNPTDFCSYGEPREAQDDG